MRANLITKGTLLLKASILEKLPLALAQPKPQQSLQPAADFGAPTPSANTTVPTLSQQPNYPTVTSPSPTPAVATPQPTTSIPSPAIVTPQPMAAAPATYTSFSGSWNVLSQGGQSSAQHLQFHLATNSAKLRGLWTQGYASQLRQPDVPNVDFTRESVIGVFLGSRPTGGYILEVASVETMSDGLRVNVNITTPARGSFTTQAFTSPWALVRVETTNLQKAYIYDDATNQLLGTAQP